MMKEELLRPMFSYSTLPIFVLIGMIGILLLLWKKLPKTKSLHKIKIEYLKKINALKEDESKKHLPKRKAYQELSKIIRQFVSEITHNNIQSSSLEEIKELKKENLTMIMEDCYVGEFSKNSENDFIKTLEKTKEMIQKWK